MDNTKSYRLTLLTNYQSTNFRLKEFADDNFKFNKNGIKLSKRVENTVEKGEIARYEQFLLFPQCFQKACFPGVSKGIIVWELVQTLPYFNSFTSELRNCIFLLAKNTLPFPFEETVQL